VKIQKKYLWDWLVNKESKKAENYSKALGPKEKSNLKNVRKG
jgi:hypothetical protein